MGKVTELSINLVSEAGQLSARIKKKGSTKFGKVIILTKGKVIENEEGQEPVSSSAEK